VAELEPHGKPFGVSLFGLNRTTRPCHAKKQRWETDFLTLRVDWKTTYGFISAPQTFKPLKSQVVGIIAKDRANPGNLETRWKSRSGDDAPYANF
jgi:hypothetical protein